MKIIFAFQILFVSAVLSQTTIVYVNQTFSGPLPDPDEETEESVSIPLDSGDGSETFPFSSLTLAFDAVNSSTEIVLLGESYTVYMPETYTNALISPIVVSIRPAQNPFIFRFNYDGKIYCYKQSDKVTMNVKGMIMTNGEDHITSTLFEGTCDLTFEDIYMDKLKSFLIRSKRNTNPNLKLKNCTLTDIQSSFLDIGSPNSPVAGELIFDSSYLKFKTARSFTLRNYNIIELKNSILEMKKSTSLSNSRIILTSSFNANIFLILNTTFLNTDLYAERFRNVIAQDSVFLDSKFFSGAFTDELAQISFNNCLFANTTGRSSNNIGAFNLYGPVANTNEITNMNISITDSKFYQNNAGGGILVLGKLNKINLTVMNSHFKSNSPAIEGGIFSCFIGQPNLTLTFQNNTFESNSAPYGSVFYFIPGDQFQMTIIDNTFINNTAGFGAVIAIPSSKGTGNISVINCRFQSNTATQGGGVCYLAPSESKMDIYFNNNTFEMNSALNGGVFYFEPVKEFEVSLTTNTFKNNKAKTGAVIFVKNSQGAGNISMINSTFNSNVATQGGGVIHVERGESQLSLILEANKFEANSAPFGGVFYLEPINKLKVTLNSDTYIKNIANPGVGGVIYVQGSTEINSQLKLDIIINNTRFHGNQASTSGGVLAVSRLDEGIISVANSEFKSNTANKSKGGALNFEIIRPDVTLVFENNTFSSNSAIIGGVTNFESLDQVQVILRNNTFGQNVAVMGAAIAFQSSKKIKQSYNVSVLVTDSKFENNQASDSGGALALISLKGGDITIDNSLFVLNSAVTGGGAILASQVEEGVLLKFHKTRFYKNSALEGGVLKFAYVNETELILENNNYKGNFGKFSGGIGYIINSQVSIRDLNSSAAENIASIEGGAWSIQGESSTTNFQNIVFEDTFAKSRGGCIYYSASSLMLTNVTFTNCSSSDKESYGGALLLTGNSVIQAQKLRFINNQAEFGASIAFQDINEGLSHSFEDTYFTFDLPKSEIKHTINSQVQSEKGGLFMKNITIDSLKTPFLYHPEGSLQFEDINVSNVKCEEDSLTFCLFSLARKGTKETFFAVRKMNVQNISSIVPLILSQKSNLSLYSIMIKNVESNAKISVGSFQESQINIDGFQLSNITSNFLEVSANSVLNISNGIFDNQVKKNAPTSGVATQFILLSESSININSTRFSFNSLDFPEKGGAIQLANPKTLELRNVNFTENRAISGGALSIEGSVISGIISNCMFAHNFVPKETFSNPGFGGAIYIQNSSVKLASRVIQQQSYQEPTFVIEGSLFQQNSALNGGAIYNKEVSLVMQNNIFDSNQAISGGGLAIDVENPSIVIDILQSRFENNIGSLYGASIFQLKKDVIHSKIGTTFANETQQFDRGVPAMLRIRTFFYDDRVQYLISSLDVIELEKLGHLTLEYDSFYNHSIKLDHVKGGKVLDRLLEISVYDTKGNRLTELQSDDGWASLEILKAVYPSNSNNNVSSVIGITTSMLSDGAAVFFQKTSFFAFPKTLLDIEISMLITHRALGNLIYNLNGSFQIELSNCIVGEIFNKETLICDSCKPNHFSLVDPFEAKICQKCDSSKVSCPGGSAIYPKPGYWRLSPMTDNVISCPFSQACLGGRLENSNEERFSLVGFCNDIEGYEGNACSTCKPGFAKFGSGKQCTNCKDNSFYYVRMIGLLALQIGIIIFNIYSNLRPRATTDEEKANETLTLVQGTVTKMIIDYVQIFTMISSVEVEWPDSFRQFDSVLSKSVPSAKDVFTVDCFFSLALGTNENVFFYKLLVINSQPFVFFIFGGLFWILWTKVIKKQGLIGKSQFRNNLLVTNCLIAYLLQPDIVKNTLQLFKCQNLGQASEPQNYLQQDLEVKCGDIIHLTWALGLGIPTLIIWLLLPLFVFVRIIMRGKKLNQDQETLSRYHFVFRRYKEDRIYWDLFILIRKSALIFIMVFLTNNYSQISLSLLVCLCALHLHYKRKPYTENFNLTNLSKKNFSLNFVETLGLISNCFLLFGGLFFIESKEFGVIHVFLIILIFAINVLFLSAIAKIFYWVISNKIKKLLKKKDSKKIIINTDQNTPKEAKLEKHKSGDEENEFLSLPKLSFNE